MKLTGRVYAKKKWGRRGIKQAGGGAAKLETQVLLGRGHSSLGRDGVPLPTPAPDAGSNALPTRAGRRVLGNTSFLLQFGKELLGSDNLGQKVESLHVTLQ